MGWRWRIKPEVVEKVAEEERPNRQFTQEECMLIIQQLKKKKEK